MRKDELTLPRIAKLMGKSVSWVYSRLEEEYSPAKSRTVTEEDRLECLLKKAEEIKEGLKKLDEKEKELTVKFIHVTGQYLKKHIKDTKRKKPNTTHMVEE